MKCLDLRSIGVRRSYFASWWPRVRPPGLARSACCNPETLSQTGGEPPFSRSILPDQTGHDDVAPKFYPVLSSFPGDAAGTGAKLFALRSAKARRGVNVEANSAGVCQPSCEWGREPL
jgi:hypothetical protein